MSSITGMPMTWELCLRKLPSLSDAGKTLKRLPEPRCPDLTFSPNSFEPLHGHPFHQGAAERVLLRLSVLNEIRNCFDEHGTRTLEGHRLYQKHFTGDKAWFSDSSVTEKNDFRTQLTFPNPSINGGFAVLSLAWQG